MRLRRPDRGGGNDRFASDGTTRYGIGRDAWLELAGDPARADGADDDLLVADVQGRHWRLRRRVPASRLGAALWLALAALATLVAVALVMALAST